MECNKQSQKLSDNKMGIDLGVKELAVISFNNKIYFWP
jgi:transposase